MTYATTTVETAKSSVACAATSTKAPFESKDFDLNDLASETIDFLSREVVLRSKLAGAPLRINGDPIQLQQVLSNLILNPSDAASDMTRAERAVTVATARNGEFAEISVLDTGSGVPQAIAEKLFDPFF